MNAVVIDTNYYSEAMKGVAKAVQLFKTTDKLIMTPIVIAELLAGFKIGRRESENREQLGHFLNTPRIATVSISETTSDFYSHIFYQLRADGTPIPTNDIWIAACAMEHGAKVATHDAHFAKIKGIYLWDQ